MKLKRIGLFVLATALVVAPLTAQDWVGKARISGTVTDQDNNPIEGAEVRIWTGADQSRGPEPMVTKKNGRWGFLGITTGMWTVQVLKEGKMPSEGQVQISQSINKPIQVRLRDIPEELLYNQRALEAKQLLDEGNALLEAGDFDAARSKYREGMEGLDPEYHATVLLAIATSYSRQSNPAEAMKNLQEARALDPENADVLLALARAHYDDGNVDQAISGLQELLVVQPDNELALQVVSDMLVAEGRVDEAEQYITRLPEGTKLDPNAILNVGIDHYNAGEMDEAFERFDQVVTGYPEMAMALYYRGLVYLGRGDNELAAADLKKFLEMEPDSPRAAEAKEFLSYIE